MNYDYEKALNEAMERVMENVEHRLNAAFHWFIHDWISFKSGIPYEDAAAMEIRAFGRCGKH